MEMESGDSELLIQLIEEIKSLGRERRDLLRSLTPTLSHWKHGEEGKSQETTTWRSIEEAENTSSQQQQQQPYTPPRYNEEELANLLDVILEDMEGLGHRMLSTAYVVDKPSAPLPLYTADELVSTTAGLVHVSKKFHNNTKNYNTHNNTNNDDEHKGQEDDEFLFLCRNYLQSPDGYKNELALNLTAAEEEKEKEKNRKRKEKEEKEEERLRHKNRTDREKDPSTMEFLAFRERGFALYRASWESVWGSYGV